LKPFSEFFNLPRTLTLSSVLTGRISMRIGVQEAMSVQNSLAGFLEIILGLLIGRLVFFRSSSFSVQQLALRKIVLGYGR